MSPNKRSVLYVNDLVSFGSGGVWNERLLKDPQFDGEKVLPA